MNPVDSGDDRRMIVEQGADSKRLPYSEGEENEEINKMKNQPGENWFRMEAFGSLSFGCVGPG
jgi:hypothetical protein